VTLDQIRRRRRRRKKAKSLNAPSKRHRRASTQDYAREDRGMEIRTRQRLRMATKPEHHDAVRAFAKSLKPPIRLSLPALETLAVIA